MPEWKFLTTQRIRVKRRVEIPPPGDLSKLDAPQGDEMLHQYEVGINGAVRR
jgi:hypothetical protein